MGIINDMKDKFNKVSHQNDKPVPKKNKKKDIKGFKDYLSLLGPNAQKRFSINTELRKKQMKGRFTMAAFAATLAISGGVAIHNVNSVSNEQPTQFEQDNTVYDKDTLLSEAENKILDCVYGENNHKDMSKVYYYRETPNDFSLNVAHTEKHDISIDKSQDYTYSGNRKNDKRLAKLMKQMVNINAIDNPSQKDLQELNDLLEDVKDIKFKLNDEGVIVEDTEKENDFERD